MLSDLRLTKLGIIRKSQNWMETASLTEAEKNWSQRVRKSKYQSFVVLSNFTLFPYFISNNLSEIMGTCYRICVTEITLDVWDNSHYCCSELLKEAIN